MKNLLTPLAIALACLGLWGASPNQAMAQDDATFEIDTSSGDFGDIEFDTSGFDEFDESGNFEPGPEDATAVAAARASMFCITAFMGLYFILIIIWIVGMWKMFAKAGQPGWAAIVPLYNIYVLCEICGKDVVWFILALIPCVNVVVGIILMIELAKAFGKGGGFVVGLILLSPIFMVILGFGKAEYVGVKAA